MDMVKAMSITFIPIIDNYKHKRRTTMKSTKFLYKLAAITLAITMAVMSVVAVTKSASAATGQICTQYGTTTQGSYTIMNNRWGTTATQCINVTNNGFQITQQD